MCLEIRFGWQLILDDSIGSLLSCGRRLGRTVIWQWLIESVGHESYQPRLTWSA